jgi:hypothetical protein
MVSVRYRLKSHRQSFVVQNTVNETNPMGPVDNNRLRNLILWTEH